MKSQPTAQRGSVVLVALCLTLVLGVAVAGYVAMCARTMEMSNRSFCTTSSVQLAEIGMEEALWSLNQALNTSGYTWPGWTLAMVSGVPTATKQLTGFPTNKGIQSQVKIRIDNYNVDQNTTPPQSYTQPLTITVDGISLMPDGITIDKQLIATVKPAALFSNAVGSTATINSSPPPPPYPPYYVAFISGGSVDSYDSSLSTDPSDQIQIDNHKRDQAIISGSYVSIGDANIYGYATTANNSCPTPPYFYPPLITGGSVTSLPATGSNRLSNNANQYAFDIVAPTGAGTTATDATDLINQTGGQLGTSGSSIPSIYHVTGDLTLLSSTDHLSINGPVIINVSGNLTIQGSAHVVVSEGHNPDLSVNHGLDGSAQIYVAGDLDIGGGVNVYVADSANDTVRKITPAGVVTTFAGSFNLPKAVAVDSAGNVYVADTSNHTIRMITPTGVVSTLAGMAGISGSTDGTGSAARFYLPAGVAVDSSSNVYVADTNNYTIRQVTPAGVVITLAGTAGTQGIANGTGSAAQFSSPTGLSVDSSGNVYVADAGNNTIRKVSPGGAAYTTYSGVVTTFAGSMGNAGYADGTGSAAQFNNPAGLTLDSQGNLYVADTSNDTIRKITPAGVVTTLAGSAGNLGSADGTGSAARFNLPGGVAVDAAGNVYVADTINDTIRKITPAGVVTTLAGSAGNLGSANGTGSAARFNSPTGLAVDNWGINNLTRRPRKLAIFCSSPGGMVTPPSATINTATPFYGAVYAPNSPLIAGSVSVDLTVYGALVGQSVTFNGTPTIHYDLDLRKTTFSVVNTPYDVSQWIVSN